MKPLFIILLIVTLSRSYAQDTTYVAVPVKNDSTIIVTRKQYNQMCAEIKQTKEVHQMRVALIVLFTLVNIAAFVTNIKN